MLVLAFAALSACSSEPAFVRYQQELALLHRIEGSFSRSVDAEKSAVLADSDEESKRFAAESRRSQASGRRAPRPLGADPRRRPSRRPREARRGGIVMGGAQGHRRAPPRAGGREHEPEGDGALGRRRGTGARPRRRGAHRDRRRHRRPGAGSEARGGVDRSAADPDAARSPHRLGERRRDGSARRRDERLGSRGLARPDRAGRAGVGAGPRPLRGGSRGVGGLSAALRPKRSCASRARTRTCGRSTSPSTRSARRPSGSARLSRLSSTGSSRRSRRRAEPSVGGAGRRVRGVADRKPESAPQPPSPVMRSACVIGLAPDFSCSSSRELLQREPPRGIAVHRLDDDRTDDRLCRRRIDGLHGHSVSLRLHGAAY